MSYEGDREERSEAELYGGHTGILAGVGWLLALATLCISAMLFFAEVKLELQSVFEFTLSFFLLFFAACVMYFSLWDVGAVKGGEDKTYQRLKEEHHRLCEQVEEDGGRGLGEFCEGVKQREVKRRQARLVRAVGIPPEEYWRLYANRPLPRELSPRQRRACRRADRVRPPRLDCGILLHRSGMGQREALLAPSPTKVGAFRSVLSLSTAALAAAFSVGIVFEWLGDPGMETFLLCLCKLFTLTWNGVKGYRGGYYHKTRDENAYFSSRSRLLREFLMLSAPKDSLKRPVAEEKAPSSFLRRDGNTETS